MYKIAACTQKARNMVQSIFDIWHWFCKETLKHSMNTNTEKYTAFINAFWITLLTILTIFINVDVHVIDCGLMASHGDTDLSQH